MYPIEMMLMEGMRREVKNSPFFASKLVKVQEYLDQGYSRAYLTSDFSRYDLTFYWEFQKLLWQAIAKLYALPEHLCVLCCAYGMSAPVILPEDDWVNPVGFVLQRVWGINRSGIGAFVNQNHAGNAVAEVVAAAELSDMTIQQVIDEVPPGIVWGDDRAGPALGLHPERWALATLELTGFRMKAAESHIATDTVKLLRKLYSPQGECAQPVVMSVWRNGLCPRRPTPSALPDEYVAVVLRAQTLNLYYAQLVVKRYGDVLDYWDQWLPAERLMYAEYPDDSALVARLNEIAPWANEEISELDWVKYQHGDVPEGDAVVDSVEWGPLRR